MLLLYMLLSMFSSQQNLLKKIHKILKKGGTLVIETLLILIVPLLDVTEITSVIKRQNSCKPFFRKSSLIRFLER